MTTLLTEAGPVLEATPNAKGVIEVTLITPGWGSSGYYPAEVLEQAARDRIWPAGTQCFIDHPGEFENRDRPERSVKDLASVLTEDARWDGTRLVALAQLLPPHSEVLAQPEMAKAIGMSIRASADVEMGEAEGRRGRIVKQLVYGESVDFVTRAGRGGRYQVIESARPTKVVERAVRHGVEEATANELREQLQQALRDAYGAEDVWVWVRDFDDSNVWFEMETPDSAGTYQHSYSAGDSGVSLSGGPVEVRPETTYVPVDPAGDAPTQESQEDTMPQIEEGRLSQLEEAAGRVPTLESERDAAVQRATTAEARIAAYEARETARPLIATHLAEAQEPLPAAAQARVVEAVSAGTIPTNDQGIDTDALNTLVEAAAAREAAYLRSIGVTPAPTGSLFGSFGSLNESAGAGKNDISESEFDQVVGGAFGRKVSA